MSKHNYEAAEATTKTSEDEAQQPKAKVSRGRRILYWVCGILIVCVGLPAVALLIAYARADVPEPGELATSQISQIYAADSATELARIVPPDGNRQQVSWDQIPETLQNAVVAAEDREFWTNPGFSVSGFGRAILGQITGNDSAGGGSTITQQYVKNTLVGNERSVQRKIRELVYSMKMANEWSKEEVLGAYLNTVYFGRNAYGVEAASQAYFGKDVSDLTTEEGAVLAAAIQRPSQLDPWYNREAAESRWNYVLDGMVSIGALTQEERDQAVYPETIDPADYSAYTEADEVNGLIKNQVVAELAELGITEEELNTLGLRVTTTIDTQAQASAREAVANALDGTPDNTRSAVVSIDPRTGGVRAYYGGEDSSGWDYANAGLQTGSTFKIFGLAAALQQGIPLSAVYSSAPVELPGGITVTNSEGNSCGYCTIKEALKQSLNTSFIRLQEDLENGTQDTADMAHALGVAQSFPGVENTLTENGEQPYEGVILGQYQTRAIDMASGLATLSNQGVYHQAHFVSRVEAYDGTVLYERAEDQGERRVSVAVANNVVDAMLPIPAYSNGNTLAGGREATGKTGTTQLGDTGSNKDAWMIGSTPQLATAVWVGTDDNSALVNAWGSPVYGSGLPATIWKNTMDGALEGQDFEYFADATAVTWGQGSYGNAVPATTWTQQQQTIPEATEEQMAPTTEDQPSVGQSLQDAWQQGVDAITGGGNGTGTTGTGDTGTTDGTGDTDTGTGTGGGGTGGLLDGLLAPGGN